MEESDDMAAFCPGEKITDEEMLAFKQEKEKWEFKIKEEQKTCADLALMIDFYKQNTLRTKFMHNMIKNLLENLERAKTNFDALREQHQRLCSLVNSPEMIRIKVMLTDYKKLKLEDLKRLRMEDIKSKQETLNTMMSIPSVKRYMELEAERDLWRAKVEQQKTEAAERKKKRAAALRDHQDRVNQKIVRLVQGAVDCKRLEDENAELERKLQELSRKNQVEPERPHFSFMPKIQQLYESFGTRRRTVGAPIVDVSPSMIPQTSVNTSLPADLVSRSLLKKTQAKQVRFNEIPSIKHITPNKNHPERRRSDAPILNLPTASEPNQVDPLPPSKQEENIERKSAMRQGQAQSFAPMSLSFDEIDSINEESLLNATFAGTEEMDTNDPEILEEQHLDFEDDSDFLQPPKKQIRRQQPTMEDAQDDEFDDLFEEGAATNDGETDDFGFDDPSGGGSADLSF